jgi:hypothetical protein
MDGSALSLLTLSHTHSLSLSHSLTLTHSLSLSLSLSLSHSLTLTLTHSLSLSLSLSLTHSLSLSLTLSLTHSLSLSQKTRPDQTRSDQIRPDQTRPGRTSLREGPPLSSIFSSPAEEDDNDNKLSSYMWLESYNKRPHKITFGKKERRRRGKGMIWRKPNEEGRRKNDHAWSVISWRLGERVLHK